MNEEIITTLMENFIIDCKKKNISAVERSNILKKLLSYKNCSQRELARDLGIKYSTLHDWITLRQDNTGENIHLSFINFIRKLEAINPETFTDWGRLEQIRSIVDKKLKCKK